MQVVGDPQTRLCKPSRIFVAQDAVGSLYPILSDPILPSLDPRARRRSTEKLCPSSFAPVAPFLNNMYTQMHLARNSREYSLMGGDVAGPRYGLINNPLHLQQSISTPHPELDSGTLTVGTGVGILLGVLWTMRFRGDQVLWARWFEIIVNP